MKGNLKEREVEKEGKKKKENMENVTTRGYCVSCVTSPTFRIPEWHEGHRDVAVYYLKV